MTHTTAGPQAREQALRRRLGIPADAARVLILAESSHWDPDWLRTSSEYYPLVRANLDRAIDELVREPRRVYSVECLFFLRLYWEDRPELQDKVRWLVNEGRLRLTSSGVTTADTLIPRPEAILRDWLLGQEWLRANGMAPEPRLAYFTDSFGCSPALPSLLRAAGYDRTAITRVDGMYFGGADYEPESHFPRPGSTAEQLMKEARSLDFVWRGPDGSEVLAHWNAFTYGQGDMLAHHGIGRMYIVPLAWADRSERHVARRIAGYIAQLAPLSRTPYLFCPIGFDFVGPIPDLVALLDRYNQVRYPESGVWAVNAGLDDYLELVDGHRALLPTLALDPNPYWTGFYTSRPTLKRQCHELVERLLCSERLNASDPCLGQASSADYEPPLWDAWWIAATANHHDFITGTSPDRVVHAEQQPWLERACQAADAAIDRLRKTHRRGAEDAVGAVREPPLLAWHREDGRIVVRTAHYALELDEAAGGAIVRAWEPESGTALLVGPSHELVSYRDSGGLWRMGHEFRGGHLTAGRCSSERPAALQVSERLGGIEIACAGRLDGEPVRRLLWLDGSPLIRGRVVGRAAKGRTVTLRFATGLAAQTAAMDVPGGLVERPLVKLYDPTFWPLQRFWHAQDAASGRGVALLVGLPGAVACRPGGCLEVVALRNATRERAWGLLPILATPATGHEREPYAFDYALLFTAGGDWRANELPAIAQALDAGPWGDPSRAELHALCTGVATVDRSDVSVIAVKPAWRGAGLIVRLYTLSAYGEPVTLRLPGREVQAATLCDARERDLGPLAVCDGAVRLTMPGAIATVRVVV
ncbi:MAG TPA: hypothetical protein PLJ35_11075 [Anaerolineae bacterium]|nr:hypothetical protein [Anaerolineae bacterium]HPL26787.1 hypothetical protein [Anaerolineae bacterium]